MPGLGNGLTDLTVAAAGVSWAWALAYALAAAALAQSLSSWWRLRHVPGPFPAGFTNLLRVWWVKTEEAQLHHQRAHERYGDVVRIGPNMVSIANPDDLPTVYPTRPGFPKSDFYATLRPYTPHGGAMQVVFNTQDEDVHKRLKSPIAPLYSLSRAVALEGRMDAVLGRLADQLDARFAGGGGGGGGETFDLGDWLQFFAFEVMGDLSFSKKYGFLEQGRDINGMLAAILGFMKTASTITQMPWIDRFVRKNRLVYSLSRTPGMAIMGFVGAFIRERLVSAEKDSVPGGDGGNGDDRQPDAGGQRQKDFLATFLEIKKENPDLPEWAPVAWTFSNVIAGSDSVGTIMRTTIYNLLAHPDTMKELERELLGSGATRPCPRWSEISELPYLEACVQEAVRVHPPFALPLERVVPPGGIRVSGGIHLPAGTVVGGNPYVVNRHRPTFGDDAEAWNPGRWLGRGEDHKRHLERSMLTFGYGRRVCLGKNLGLVEVKKLVAFLVMNYDIQIIDANDFTVRNVWFFRQQGLRVRIQRRQ